MCPWYACFLPYMHAGYARMIPCMHCLPPWYLTLLFCMHVCCINQWTATCRSFWWYGILPLSGIMMCSTLWSSSPVLGLCPRNGSALSFSFGDAPIHGCLRGNFSPWPLFRKRAGFNVASFDLEYGKSMGSPSSYDFLTNSGFLLLSWISFSFIF